MKSNNLKVYHSRLDSNLQEDVPHDHIQIVCFVLVYSWISGKFFKFAHEPRALKEADSREHRLLSNLISILRCQIGTEWSNTEKQRLASTVHERFYSVEFTPLKARTENAIRQRMPGRRSVAIHLMRSIWYDQIDSSASFPTDSVVALRLEESVSIPIWSMIWRDLLGRDLAKSWIIFAYALFKYFLIISWISSKFNRI